MMRTESSLRTREALVAFTVMLTACQQITPEAPRPRVRTEAETLRRENAMNQQWQNHRYSELLAVMGPPTEIMQIPGGGNPPGFAVVFGRDKSTGCIDAFAMLYGTDPIVRYYYCR